MVLERLEKSKEQVQVRGLPIFFIPLLCCTVL